MSNMLTNNKTTRSFGLALLTLTALACAKVKGEPPSSGGEGASVTTAKPAADNVAPAASSAAPAATRVVPGPNGATPETTPTTTLIETPVALPSPAVLQAVSAVQGKLDGLVAGVAGTRVRFVDCSENAACTTRLEASSLTSLRDLLQAVSSDQGAIDFTAREQLDGYTGRSFIADVTLASSTPRAVPTDENELLGITP